MPEKSIRILFFTGLFSAAVFFSYYSFVTMGDEMIRLESALTKREHGPFSGQSGDLKPIQTPKDRIEALFAQAVPEKPHLPQALHAISLRAKQAGIQNVSLVSGERRAADAFFGEVKGYQWPVTVKFESTYVQLAQFVHAIETLERTAEIAGLSTLQGKAGVSAELNLIFYSRTAPPPFSMPEKKEKTAEGVDAEMVEEDEAF